MEQLQQTPDTALDRLNAGEITFNDYLVEYSKELILTGATPEEVGRAITSELYRQDERAAQLFQES